MKFTTVILIIGICAVAVYLTVMISAGKFIKNNPEILKLALL